MNRLIFLMIIYIKKYKIIILKTKYIKIILNSFEKLLKIRYVYLPQNNIINLENRITTICIFL